MKLTPEQFKEYLADPLGNGDVKVRKWCGIPEDRYYSVATWPMEKEGEVTVTPDIHRVVKTPKISKSSLP